MLAARRRRVFVTGGAGFIGSHVVDRLLADGHQVTVYDNLSSGKRSRVKSHYSSSSFSFVEGDILDLVRLSEACRGQDVVWHLAANTDIRAGTRTTDIDLRLGVIGTCNVLEAMRLNGVEQIMFASSGVVYGDFDANPLLETAGPLLPTSLYGAGKLSGEAFVSAYCHLFGIRAWIFRFANIIGGRTDHGVVYDFVQKLRRNPNELEVLGDGKQMKPYLLVDECVRGMLHAFEVLPMTEGSPCDVFNLSTDSFASVERIATIVIEEMGLGGVKIRYTGGRRGWLGDAPVILLGAEKMRGAGWVAAHSSEQAVRLAAREIISGRSMAAD
ncbi:MAG TPA: NAD-dependent epimerase/dehydratase family protein [Chloroflexota bacterium]|nr:NAD-dependent epimerase/dehydratase family protein [Chloroflexota bacterium]